MAANPPPDLQESAKRTGDTPVGDLESIIRRAMEIEPIIRRAMEMDVQGVGDLESVIRRAMDVQGGDRNAPRPARNGAALWFSDECSKAHLAGMTILNVLIVAVTMVDVFLNHPSAVIKIWAFSFAGVMSITLLLLLVGWTCGYGKMVRTGLWLFHIEYLLM